jgi:hypothetical protein
MSNYDLIILLGTQPDPETWQFPEQILNCVDKVTELMRKDVAPYVAVSGDRGVALDNKDITYR